MQEKAEEKKKGYTCVVWVERAIDKEMLAKIEALSTSGEFVDEDGEACIEVVQCALHSIFILLQFKIKILKMLCFPAKAENSTAGPSSPISA